MSSVNALLVLGRFLGEFEPAEESTATFRKSSQDIVQDLEDVVTLSVDEVTNLMLNSNFKLAFDDDKPVWLMRKRDSGIKSIPE